MVGGGDDRREGQGVSLPGLCLSLNDASLALRHRLAQGKRELVDACGGKAAKYQWLDCYSVQLCKASSLIKYADFGRALHCCYQFLAIRWICHDRDGKPSITPCLTG